MMKKKILHVVDLYPEFLKQLNQTVNFKSLTYDQILKEILKKRYAWSDILKSIKKYNFFFIFPNFQQLQLKWADENEINLNYEYDIFMEQIKYYQPDLVFFQTSITLSKIIDKVNFKYILWDGTNSKNLKIAKKSVLVLTNMPEAKKFYNLNKINSELIDHFFDIRLIKEIKKNNNKQLNVSFIGTMTNKDHFDRTIFLGELNNTIRINFFLGSTNNLIKVFAIAVYNLIFKKKTLLNCLKYIFFQFKIKNLNKGSVYGKKMYEVIKKSKIVLNFHIQSGSGLNMRVFECTGMGSCLLSDYQNNLNKYFNCEDDIICFQNIKDAENKIKNLLKNNSYRDKVALNAQKKVLSNSIFEKRKDQISKILDTII